MDDAETLTAHDEREHWRCPQLGGSVTFNYCRRMNKGLPCTRVVECWVGAFDIAQFLLDHFSEDEIRQVLCAPKQDRWTKILSGLPGSEND